MSETIVIESNRQISYRSTIEAEQTALLNGIKIFVLGAGTSGTYTAGGVTTYPWRDLATNTGGNWNLSEDPSQISSQIVAGCS